MHVLGVDAAGRFGWAGVVLGSDGFVAVHLAGTVAALIDAAEGGARAPMTVVGIDIPVGLVDGRIRAADREARRFVGPRGSSVFNAPHPDAVRFDTQAEANEFLASVGLPLMSAQAFGLVGRINEVAAIAVDDRIIETFPEASFTMLGGAPPRFSKKSWGGFHERIDLLARAIPAIRLPGDLGLVSPVPADDVFDAAACAWSAWRHANGLAIPLGDPDERDLVTGRRIAVWV